MGIEEKILNGVAKTYVMMADKTRDKFFKVRLTKVPIATMVKETGYMIKRLGKMFMETVFCFHPLSVRTTMCYRYVKITR